MNVRAVAWCVLGASVLAGCGGEASSDPYAPISLRRALYGPPVLSKGFRYKFVAPEIVEAAGDYVLVREGNVTTFVTGASLADKIHGRDRATLVFNVVKRFSPAPHFQCENVVTGADTIPIPQGRFIALPRMTNAADFTPADHTRAQMTRFRYNDTVGLEREMNRKYQLSARLVRVEEGSQEVWMLEGRGPATRGQVPILRVAEASPALRIVLALVARSGAEFNGGVTFVEVEPWVKRQRNHVCGTVEVNYLTFLDRVFRG